MWTDSSTSQLSTLLQWHTWLWEQDCDAHCTATGCCFHLEPSSRLHCNHHYCGCHVCYNVDIGAQWVRCFPCHWTAKNVSIHNSTYNCTKHNTIKVIICLFSAVFQPCFNHIITMARSSNAPAQAATRREQPKPRAKPKCELEPRYHNEDPDQIYTEMYNIWLYASSVCGVWCVLWTPSDNLRSLYINCVTVWWLVCTLIK